MVLNFCAENGIFSYRSNKTLNLTTDTKVCTWSYGLPLAPNLEHGFTFHSTYKAEFVRLQHPRRQPNCLLLGLSSTRIAIKFWFQSAVVERRTVFTKRGSPAEGLPSTTAQAKQTDTILQILKACQCCTLQLPLAYILCVEQPILRINHFEKNYYLEL